MLINKFILVLYYLLYRTVFCFLPIRKKTVCFEAYWGKSYSCNPRSISEYLSANTDYNIVWFFNDKSKFVSELNCVEKFSIKYFYLLATSGYFVANANFPNFFHKRKRMLFVQTKHGTPLKSMGIDELEKKKNNTKLINELEKRCDNWDYVISSNDFSTKQWSKSFPFDYQILPIGYPRNDRLFNYTGKDIIDIKKDLNIDVDENRTIILIMPTFREYHKEPNYFIDFYDLVSELSSKYLFLIRSHYFNDDSSNIPKLDGIIDVTNYTHVEDLYIISDILISDYSSSIFDYACLNRSIILYVPDYEEYQEKRGLNFDIREEPPGVITYNYEQLVKTLEYDNYTLAECKIKATEFHNKFCNYDDGSATKRLCEFIFTDEPNL